MRRILIAPALWLVGLAGAADLPAIDLDQPGALDQLRLEHPQRFQAVSAVLKASTRAPCQNDELRLIETRFDVRDVECGIIVYTRYPALRHVSFALDGTRYRATVELEVTDTLRPIGTTPPSSP